MANKPYVSITYNRGNFKLQAVSLTAGQIIRPDLPRKTAIYLFLSAAEGDFVKMSRSM